MRYDEKPSIKSEAYSKYTVKPRIEAHGLVFSDQLLGNASIRFRIEHLEDWQNY